MRSCNGYQSDRYRPVGQDIWDFPFASIDCYMLWGYGSEITLGMDVLRLTSEGGHLMFNKFGYGYAFMDGEQQYYNDSGIMYSHPESYGGGEFGEMPVYPPLYRGLADEYIYGSPDGWEDGVILVLTSGGS